MYSDIRKIGAGAAPPERRGTEGAVLTIFNRRELAVTLDMGRQAEIRNILAANNVKYLIRTHSSGGSSAWNRGRMGSFGQNTALSYVYKIYVHKDDYAGALALIG